MKFWILFVLLCYYQLFHCYYVDLLPMQKKLCYAHDLEFYFAFCDNPIMRVACCYVAIFSFLPEQSHAKHKLLQSQYESYRSSGEENSERINKLVSSFTKLMTEIRDNHAASLVDYDVSAMLAGLIMTVTVSQLLNMHV